MCTFTILLTLVLYGTTTILAAPSAPLPYEFEDVDSWMPLPRQISSYYALTNGVSYSHPHDSRRIHDADCGSGGALNTSFDGPTLPGSAASPSSGPSSANTNAVVVQSGHGGSGGSMTAETRSEANNLVLQIKRTEPDTTMTYEADEAGGDGPWWRKGSEGLWWRRDVKTGVLKPVGAHLSTHGVHVDTKDTSNVKGRRMGGTVRRVRSTLKPMPMRVRGARKCL